MGFALAVTIVSIALHDASISSSGIRLAAFAFAGRTNSLGFSAAFSFTSTKERFFVLVIAEVHGVLGNALAGKSRTFSFASSFSFSLAEH